MYESLDIFLHIFPFDLILAIIFFLFCLYCIYCRSCKNFGMQHVYVYTHMHTHSLNKTLLRLILKCRQFMWLTTHFSPHGQSATVLSSPQHPCHHTLMYFFIVCLQCPSFSIYLNPILKVPSSPWSLLKYFNPLILYPLKSCTYHYYMVIAGVMICTSKFHKTLNTKRPHNEYHLDGCLINKHSYSSIFSYFLFM